MYATYQTVSKAQGWDGKRREQTRANYLKHKGMQKSHIQITPDGKVIQHFVIDSRSAAVKKAFQKAFEEAQAKKENEAIVDAVKS